MLSLKGDVDVAPDKSISHRALMIAAISCGTSRINNLLLSDDCISTLKCLEKLSVDITQLKGSYVVKGSGRFLKSAVSDLDAGNSGTTARMISGILAGQNFKSRIIGDASLSARPMKRVVVPLQKMGARIKTHNWCLPMDISGGELNAIHYVSEISSAQVKSCVLLAGLFACGITKFSEPVKSRDHTERMLKNFGADISVEGDTVSVKGCPSLSSFDVTVPGDISAAAFFIVGALITRGSNLVIKNVGINPTRTGVLNVLKRMGGNIVIENTRVLAGEPVADIIVRSSDLKATEITGAEVPFMIDEIPVIAVAATQAMGETRITGASELRVKETDRLKAITSEIKKMGAVAEELEDGLIIKGPVKLKGAKVDSYKDHRIAMSLAIASLIAEGDTIIKDKDCVTISFPDFWKKLKETVK
ncbi:MAG: 3-phosphoshikimate 1-carboxyvinyltransferase 1 [Elusimicrobia bacterium ADurb.Bin231]|nr:MAG: 3-phosphoshikimate 1-carboxyvinyltransferase 1 [Elusimicrobia bacterium ADurb.Bin231]